MEIQGKTIVVTGASQGIGAALAQALAAQGAKVVCAARSGSGLAATVSKIDAAGGQAFSIPTDVTNQAAVERLIAETVSRFGSVDALVNNAALVGNRTGLDQDLSAFRREIEVNLYGPLYAIVAALPHLKASKGAILNVSSLRALNVMPGMFAYGVSKIALERLTLDVAEQLEESGIACNALRIDLPVFPANWTPDPDQDPKAAAQISARLRFAEPLETGAAAMIWMLSQSGASYTGKLESLRDLVERRVIHGKAAELMPLSVARRWTW